MCGFVGVITDNKENEINNNTLVNMTNLIIHRGPDDVGYYFGDHVKFGFRRLSIIDLKSGKQPLTSENNRYTIVFNGEIYNYLELKVILQKKGYSFKTDTDTEVIIALFSEKKELAFEELRGMFSIVIWDTFDKVLYGARDRFGIKPFYYFEDGSDLFFASEKKSLLLAKARNEINEDALHHYLTYQYVPEPFTMSSDILKMEPGCYFKKKVGQPLKIKKYWSPNFTPVIGNIDESTKEIIKVLRNSVQFHMRSDVPVGSFLSSGIDSTSIVAFAKEVNPNIKTFTVGFEREGYSEINVAKESADKMGVENISKEISPNEFIQELPKIIWHMDDPVADPAAIPLYFVSKLAREHVKVVLSGEGADELFGGYGIYKEPISLKGFSSMSASNKERLKSIISYFPSNIKGKNFIERGCTPIEERYIGNAKLFSENEKELLLQKYNFLKSYQDITKPYYDKIPHYDDVSKMQYIDMHTWLSGDILVKADRMTMAHSIELRVPFLDKGVFSIASKLHSNIKVTRSEQKYALRKALEGIVPDHVVNRRKLGFPVPIRHWLQDELYDWARNLIIFSNTEYLFNKAYILKLLEKHRKGNFDRKSSIFLSKKSLDFSRHIWAILTFMIWHQIFIEKDIQSQNSLIGTKQAELVL
ncbi:asparagine synthase (glutamine-hydrolyzing) [Anaerobacillus isosaccharinicus]|uniref:asparagine synthase (glutamine-hydrolyzing) n=1 Tax=Anaerobacillus isosaccharinicus TaxID=1532552 RepID=A0A1S2LI14_9BACI|nr:asparagine synthase (glutamine-hydrolyzing) [Anaerobacillus isosaccharinicus]MBA5584736.1 asparagine synthase (glutamine-hydrolyzing) [Anaerobacillus isosaccharinicus]QOY36895.1 asparagine synthase (glutamine-hydrolyzing) [Anaerobacillus isosaccharinicus]